VSRLHAHWRLPKGEVGVFIGLRTVVYPVSDMAQAKAWYSDVFGCSPYFDQPFYAGFAVGGFEMGLIPDGEPSAEGAIAYWGVSDAAAELKRLAQLRVVIHEPLKDVGGGVKVAAIKDPFGNLIGIIENPHFNLQDVR
jgi:predicted enzyme related to lactoylglutathione lyase